MVDGRVTDYTHGNIEYIGNSFYIPISGNCFVKCFIYLTSKVFAEEVLTFEKNNENQN